MNYLIPTFDCVLFDGEKIALKKNVKYKLKSMKQAIVFGFDDCVPYVFDMKVPSKNVLKVQHANDNHYFLFPHVLEPNFSTHFKFKNQEIELSLSSKLLITINSELKCEKIVENLTYSHFEILGDLCLIYFNGKRGYIVVIKNNDVAYASYYDECNANENEKLFLCKQFDSLNHGEVCQIKNKEFSSYLVYLDDEELSLKPQFVPHIFLDCVLVENFKYCKELLNKNLQVEDEKSIKLFFPEFDYFYPLSENVFMLANKNTLAGIFEFFVENNQIVNIINH